MRLVIVDDAAYERAALVRFAPPETVVAGIAEDAEAAVALLERIVADAAVVDGRIPPAGCLPLVARMRARWPRLPVLVVVSSEESELAASALRAGATGILFRPLLPASVREQLERVARTLGAQAE